MISTIIKDIEYFVTKGDTKTALTLLDSLSFYIGGKE